MPRLINRSIPFVFGKSRRLSTARKFMRELLHFSKKIPSVPAQRKMRIKEIIEARASRTERISWCAIFIKAYSIVAARRPELRRSFLSFPWAHIYEHPINVASFTVEREYQGENTVFFAKVARPESLSLVLLDAIVKEHKKTEVRQIKSFRTSLLMGKLPFPLSRFVWWLGLETSGPKKAYHFGTFGISVVARFGAASLHLLSPLTTTLNYGVIEDDGTIDVRITYDHRVIDGADIARALVDLDETLHTLILEELRSVSDLESAPPAFEESRSLQIVLDPVA